MAHRLTETRWTPAKVNLSLLVGPVRPDGYHLILSVFAPLGLYDEITFSLWASRRGTPLLPLQVLCDPVPYRENLVTQALTAVCAETGWALEGEVRVKKVIPFAAGLGGGSSDAALALLVGASVVREAGGPVLHRENLLSLARRLGADVPFFLDPRPCLVKGIGEILEPLELPSLPLVVMFPDERLATGEVYRTFDRVARSDPAAFTERSQRMEAAWRSLSAGWASGELDWDHISARITGLLCNDLEAASVHFSPGLAARKAALEAEGVLGTVMSGSGPTVVGVCASPAEAERVAARLSSKKLPAQALQTWGADPSLGRPSGVS